LIFFLVFQKSASETSITDPNSMAALNLAGEARMRKYVADAQQISIDGPNESDFTDVKALSSLFTAIISKFRINYSSIALKLGMSEIEMLRFLNGSDETLDESKANIRRWIQSFVDWIKKHDPKTVAADFKFSIEEIMDLRPKRSSSAPITSPPQVILPAAAKKSRGKNKQPVDEKADPQTFQEWEQLLLGDLVLAKDDSGAWHNVKITRREGTFLKLLFLSDQGQVDFWIDTSKRSALVKIPENTRRLVQARLKSTTVHIN
jgi:hypothetical protein